MIEIKYKQDCSGCHACYNICRQQCIRMANDDDGFWYPVVNLEECTDCSLCEEVCPILCRNPVDNHPVAYACINKDEHIRQQSSSGGIFTLIAEREIDDNGIVFGAGFNDEFNVVHSWTDNLEGLGKFRGSKYVQSCIGDTYKEVGDFLKQDRQVLFSGTPCQIAGLRSYLGKEYDNLFCADIVCHGVPSPKVWQRYKKQMEETHQAKAKRISFRHKNSGWKLFSISFLFDNNIEYRQKLNADIFIQGFLKDLYLRPSCYACSFKTLKRQSDITLADFWGIENVMPDFDDDKGTSLVLLNSPKGAKIWATIADLIYCQKVDIQQAISNNPSAVKSVDANHKRDQFFEELDGAEDINKLIAKYTKVSFPMKTYVKVKGMLFRFKRRFKIKLFP